MLGGGRGLLKAEAEVKARTCWWLSCNSGRVESVDLDAMVWAVDALVVLNVANAARRCSSWKPRWREGLETTRRDEKEPRRRFAGAEHSELRMTGSMVTKWDVMDVIQSAGARATCLVGHSLRSRGGGGTCCVAGVDVATWSQRAGVRWMERVGVGGEKRPRL